MKNLKRNVDGITLIALVVTIQVNCCFTAMERKIKKEEKLKKEPASYII